jgi:hypothetical protein
VELSDTQARKLNEALRTILGRSAVGDAVAAVLILRPQPGRTPTPLDPADFPNRTAYREAVIAQEQELTRELLGPVLNTIAQLGLHPRGGDLHAVAVTGPAGKLLAALDLPEVARALSDEPVEQPHPKRAKHNEA